MRQALLILGGLLILVGLVAVVAAVRIRPTLSAVGSAAASGSSLSSVTLHLAGTVTQSMQRGEEALRQTERSITVATTAWSQVSQRMPHIADTARSLAEACKATGGKLHEAATMLEGLKIPVGITMENVSIFGKDFAIKPTVVLGNPFLGICAQMHGVGDQAWYMKGHLLVVADVSASLAPGTDPVAPALTATGVAVQATAATLSEVRTTTIPEISRSLEQVQRDMQVVAAGMPWVSVLCIALGCGMALMGVACVLQAQACRPAAAVVAG